MVLHTLCVFGTRPEAIKMAPVIQKLNTYSNIQNKVCITVQHHEMLHSILDFFHITPDFNLEVMEKNQQLSQLTSHILLRLGDLYREYLPQLILVHGDTCTTFAAALSAYYHHIPVAHVEAGLRTGDNYSPWPEEMYRKLTSGLATWHFAPTAEARKNLLHEGVAEQSIYVTGNTVVDSLHNVMQQLSSHPTLLQDMQQQFSFLKEGRRLLLVTGHRRENFGNGLAELCQALAHIATTHPNWDVVYPLHLNPNVKEPVTALLGDINNIYLIAPVDYLPFVYLMKRADIILTDSGGIQEEAPSLGTPVLVMREKTERKEALLSGDVQLIGMNYTAIVTHVELLLNKKSHRAHHDNRNNPYGDGQAAHRIARIISELSFPSQHNVDHMRVFIGKSKNTTE